MRNKHILLAGLFLLGGMVSAAFAVYFVIKTPSDRPVDSDAATRTSTPVVTAKAPPPAAPVTVAPLTLPILDFLRIAPAGGVSVLAGRAKPRSPVTILEGDKVVGWVEADGIGEWSHVTEHVFAPGEPKVSVREGRPSAPAAVAAAPKADTPPRSVTAVENRVVRDLEAAVAAARAEPKATETPRVASAAGIADTPRPPLPVPSEPKAVTAAAPLTGYPVPITFIYREARPTPLGDKAARLLVEYIVLKGVRSLELTGHADERGTDDFNLQLSQQRLQTVASLLRAGGYTGDLRLVPKGISDPYRGVDRGALPRDDLYQLDRRVELRSAR